MSLFSQMVVLANLFVKRTSAPVGNENALVVRNIPSGIQAVSISTQNPGIPLSYFTELNSVAFGSTETISSYTVPPGRSNTLIKIDVSGTNIATYDVYLNGVSFARLRTYFGGDLSHSLDFGNSGFNLQAGDIIEVKVTNFRPSVGDFESRVQLIET